VPLVAIPVVGFALLVAWFLLFGMHRTTNDWLTPLLTGLAHPHGSFLTRAALKPFSLAAGGVLWLVNRVDHFVSKAASHASAAVAHWLHGLAGWVTHVFSAAEAFALDVEHAFTRLVHHTIPHAIHVATVPLWRGIDHLERDLHHLQQRLTHFARGIDRLLTHRVLPALRHLEHAIAVTIPRELGRIRTRVGQLEHDLTHPSKAWIKRLARAMWAAALLGLLIRTLARRFPWLFCRKVKTVGGRICGLDADLLNALLLDTLVISGTISVVAMAKELQALEPAALAIMRAGIDEL
jgi:hypothetical protein